MLILWSVSFVIVIFAFVLGVVKLSWVYLLISTISSMPVAFYYFFWSKQCLEVYWFDSCIFINVDSSLLVFGKKGKEG